MKPNSIPTATNIPNHQHVASRKVTNPTAKNNTIIIPKIANIVNIYYTSLLVIDRYDFLAKK